MGSDEGGTTDDLVSTRVRTAADVVLLCALLEQLESLAVDRAAA
jgi:hypothetical protein